MVVHAVRYVRSPDAQASFLHHAGGDVEVCIPSIRDASLHTAVSLRPSHSNESARTGTTLEVLAFLGIGGFGLPFLTAFGSVSFKKIPGDIQTEPPS